MRQCAVCNREFNAKPATVSYGQAKFCSRDCFAKWMSANSSPKHPHKGRGGKREDLGGRYFRSSWEANYARYLNILVDKGEVAAWEFEADTFTFESIKRGCRHYTPDFKVTMPDGSTEYHEVKGWMDAKSQTKLKRMAKYFPSVKVVVIAKNSYKAIAQGAGRMIPTWEWNGDHGY